MTLALGDARAARRAFREAARSGDPGPEEWLRSFERGAIGKGLAAYNAALEASQRTDLAGAEREVRCALDHLPDLLPARRLEGVIRQHQPPSRPARDGAMDPPPGFSIQEELARLAPVELDLDAEEEAEHAPPLLEQWDLVSKNLARLGKQQMRANQAAEFLEGQLREAREQADEHRRESARLREQAHRAASRTLGIVDTLDDVMVLARQNANAKWVTHLERLTRKTLLILEEIGLTEIAAEGEPFDAEVHEALDTVEPGDGQPAYQIVQVVSRGFRYQGAVLRRAEVITTR